MNKVILFNEPRFANRNKRFIHPTSRVESLIQMIRLERVFSSELNSQERTGRSRATDAVKSKLLMSNFKINYCN